jgi:hypothetical protein
LDHLIQVGNRYNTPIRISVAIILAVHEFAGRLSVIRASVSTTSPPGRNVGGVRHGSAAEDVPPLQIHGQLQRAIQNAPRFPKHEQY